MKTTTNRVILLLSIALAAVQAAPPAGAHAPGQILASPGVTSVIDVTNTADLGEWTAEVPVPLIIDNTHPNTAEIYALHRSDGIYIRAEIDDDSHAGTDAIFIYLDLIHDAGAPLDGNDWGISVQRNGVATMGPADVEPSLWLDFASFPGAAFSLSPDASTADVWVVEMKIPNGALDGSHTLDFTIDGGRIGALIQIFSAFEFGDPLEATYNQWPDNPGIADPDCVDIAPPDTPLNDCPKFWGNYEFDPATTFPDLMLTDVRNNWNGPDHYTEISHTQLNRFQAEIDNPGGTLVPDASDVRVNFYIAPIGIGAKWRRLDQLSVLQGDCANLPGGSDWPAVDFSGVPKTDVCSDTAPHPDVETHVGNIAGIIADTVDYTVNEGVTRVGGESQTFAGGTNAFYDVLEWSTIPDQDTIYSNPQLDHQCVKAEVIFEADPNKTNNDIWRNMNFVCLPNFQTLTFNFTLGWAGFAFYDPDMGKEMILHVDLQNMDKGWGFELQGVKRVADFSYVAKLQGKRTLRAAAVFKAPPGEPFGRTLKENLVVPPKAGGRLRQFKPPTGEAPVYVRIDGGSELLIANYTFGSDDHQYVDLDGQGKLLPPNGPTGLSLPHLERFLDKVGEKFRLLLAPRAPLGALVGSFDNFKTAFIVGDGVQILSPSNATHLALAINGVIGLYDDNAGSGFRVKVIERSKGRTADVRLDLVGAAEAQEPPRLVATPIADVMPTACVQGYERINRTQVIGGKKHDLLRFIGDVCWGVINVFPRDRSDKPDQGDPGPSDLGDTGSTGDNEPNPIWILALLLAIVSVWLIFFRKSSK